MMFFLNFKSPIRYLTQKEMRVVAMTYPLSHVLRKCKANTNSSRKNNANKPNFRVMISLSFKSNIVRKISNTPFCLVARFSVLKTWSCNKVTKLIWSSRIGNLRYLVTTIRDNFKISGKCLQQIPDFVLRIRIWPLKVTNLVISRLITMTSCNNISYSNNSSWWECKPTPTSKSII